MAEFSRNSINFGRNRPPGRLPTCFMTLKFQPAMRIIVFVFFCFISCSFFGCDFTTNKGTGTVNDDSVPRVLVSIEPQKFFVQKIAGDNVVVEVLVPAGKEPETYLPTPEQIKKIGACSVFFRIGFPSEETFLPKLQTLAPNMKIVDTRKGITLRQLEAHSHDHGEHDHSHHDLSHEDEGADPHIWLSPTLVKQQADTIFQTLIEILPDKFVEFSKNNEEFQIKLDGIKRQIAEKLQPHHGETIYVFHPAYGYFCDEFGLKQKAIEIEGKSPKARDLVQWIEQAKADRVHTILVQPEFNPAPAEKIAEQIGATVAVHSTLGPNYFDDLMKLADILASAKYTINGEKRVVLE